MSYVMEVSENGIEMQLPIIKFMVNRQEDKKSIYKAIGYAFKKRLVTSKVNEEKFLYGDDK
jgi:hypothetical protein